jgi:hypothetical protein
MAGPHYIRRIVVENLVIDIPIEMQAPQHLVKDLSAPNPQRRLIHNITEAYTQPNGKRLYMEKLANAIINKTNVE